MNHYEIVAESLRYIRAHAQQQPDLAEMAAHACMSPSHFQRVFTEWAGVSPKKFLQFLTLRHAKSTLAQAASLEVTACSSGLSGTSRLHDLFLQIEGVTPGDYKKQGTHLQLNYSTGNSQFGEYIVASTSKGICHLHFFQNEQQAMQELRTLWPNASLVPQQDGLHHQVEQFFSNKLTPKAQKLPLHLRGTPFQLKVWEALLRIPEGRLSSYGTLAQSIGHQKASRAVGTAIGSNPIAFLIPCHRVIKSVGGIGEYRWGSDRKMAIIGWEAAQMQQEAAADTAHRELPLFQGQV